MRKPDVYCPKIGHGNLLEALGVAAELGGNAIFIRNWAISLLAQVHQRMTQNPGASKAYTENGSGVRGIAQGTLGRLMAGEIPKNLKTLWLVQEFALMGINPDLYAQIFLSIPDVLGKTNGVEKALRRTDARPVVWNEEAANHYKDHDPLLIEPAILSAFNPQEILDRPGNEVVYKTSGSGIPRAWHKQIVEELKRSGVTYAVHVPDGRPVRQQLNDFVNSIGQNTRYIISYMSEQVQVVALLQSMGLQVKLIGIDTRGPHEVVNAEFALRHDLARGILNLNGDHPESRTIQINQLATQIQRPVNPPAYSAPIGTIPLRDAVKDLDL